MNQKSIRDILQEFAKYKGVFADSHLAETEEQIRAVIADEMSQ